MVTGEEDLLESPCILRFEGDDKKQLLGKE